MAEGFGKQYLNEKYDVYSAGIEAHGVNPLAVKAMKEINIDISNQTSNTIDSALLQKVDIIITLCGDAEDKCPVTPPHITRWHWGLMHRQAKVEGTEEEKWTVFQRVRDEIGRRIQKFALKGK